MLDLYWQPILAYAIRMLGDKDTAEDVAQRTFIRLWEYRTRLKPNRSIRSFLYKVTRNLALNEQRSRKVRAEWRERAPAEQQPSNPTPIQALEGKELRTAAEDAIEALPPRCREVFELARFENLSYRQIAQTMEISPQTVANQISAALSKLREALAGHLEA